MEIRKIALVGNPNTGKSSLFNLLTGLRQHVGNFPGVTVDKKSGSFSIGDCEIQVLDLPGTYSVFPRSNDERVVLDIVTDPTHSDYPDVFVVVADALNLERNLLLFSQLHDLNVPLVLVLTMEDLAEKKASRIDEMLLGHKLDDIPVVFVNGRNGKGLDKLKNILTDFPQQPAREFFSDVKIGDLVNDHEGQVRDSEARFQKVRALLEDVYKAGSKKEERNLTAKLDKVLVHPIWGYAIFIGLLLLIFQFIFRFAELPMDWIDNGFLQLSQWAKGMMPSGVFTDLVAEGIIPGIGGVLVFIPQIALLFFFLSILEETGYMSRVVFIMDKLVRPFGLNGKSVVPLMSSVACAIPGIMATRTISSWKDRLITIMVAPLMSCSARIPVYTLLIALVIPEKNVLGIFSLKGLVLLGLYALGLISALLVAWVMKFMIRSAEPGYLIMEMPSYKLPRWSQVMLHLWEKVRVFVFDAGKVILAISILLWALASYGPPERMERAMTEVAGPVDSSAASQADFEQRMNATKLQNSFIGILGKTIEPVIRPLGYDWKIGIALITSFAAREVFVGSMATIYSVGEDFEDDHSLLDRLHDEKNPETGRPVYTVASGVSLMVFYAYAMQCMATFAIVKRETKSWKWPVLQMLYMGTLAYFAAFIAYQLLK